jgi:hypothetical protein
LRVWPHEQTTHLWTGWGLMILDSDGVDRLSTQVQFVRPVYQHECRISNKICGKLCMRTLSIYWKNKSNRGWLGIFRQGKWALINKELITLEVIFKKSWRCLDLFLGACKLQLTQGLSLKVQRSTPFCEGERLYRS